MLLDRIRLNKGQMSSLILEIASGWHTPQEIAAVIGKDVKYLKDRVIPRLLSEGILEREYQDTPNHPNQRYRARKD